MRSTLGRLLWVGLLGWSTAGCHTMRFRVADRPPAQVVAEHKSFFLWGLVPTEVVDVSTKCPHGAVAIMEQTGFVDGLANLVTIGVWSPRSSTYYCAAAPAAEAQP